MRKRTQNSSSHLKAIASTTTDALIAIDEAGNVISWNPAAESIFGYSTEDMIGQSLHAIIPERYQKAHDRGLERVNGGGKHHVIGHAATLAGRRKDGSEFPIELTLSTWKSGGRNHYGGIIRDISERVRMEDELRTSEARTRAITETANDGIITADSDGFILSWNKAAATIFGYGPDEAVGQSLTLIVPEQFKSAHERGIERVSGGGAPHVMGKTVELSGLHKKGHRG